MYIDEKSMILFVETKKITKSDLGIKSIEFQLKDSRESQASEFMTLIIKEPDVI